MMTFKKQLLLIISGIAILATGVLLIRAATPSGNIKVNPILGHDTAKLKVQS